MRFLKKNTAVIISVGPFIDKTDGVTLKTALTITNERISLNADTDAGSAPTVVLDNVTGATSGTSNDLNYITGQDNAMMQLELAAADTNRNGRMILTITDAANHCPVVHEFMVLDSTVYDALVQGPGTDNLDVNVTQILGTAVSTPATAGILDVNVKNIDNDAASASGTVTFPNATLASTTNITAGTITTTTTATNVTTVNGLAANVITATSINADAITAAKIADGAIDAATFAAGAIDAAAIATDAIGANEFSQAAADKVWNTTTRSLSTTPGIKKNTALADFEFFMRDSADHVSGKTGLTVVEEVSIDGGAFAALTNTFAEVANGIYKIDLAAADVNGNVVTLKFTATGADATFVTLVTDR